jgi:hypothetical protein
MYSHNFFLIDIPSGVLESIYGTVVLFPLTQYEVICSALKQICFYKAFNMLFPDGENKWTELLSVLKSQFFTLAKAISSKE